MQPHPRLKGAPSQVFQTITRLLAAGYTEFSYLDLAVESDYSLPAVIESVRRLEALGLLTVERRGHGRPNRYTLLSDDQRRTRAVAQLSTTVVVSYKVSFRKP